MLVQDSVNLEQENYFIVEKILEKKKVGKKTTYLVKWEGYSEDQNTWEPVSNLRNVKDLLLQFEAELSKNEEMKKITLKDVINETVITGCSSNLENSKITQD